MVMDGVGGRLAGGERRARGRRQPTGDRAVTHYVSGTVFDVERFFRYVMVP